MVPELEIALRLVADLPEHYQRQAAKELSHIIVRAEETMTMTLDERYALSCARADAIAREHGWKTREEVTREIRQRLNINEDDE